MRRLAPFGTLAALLLTTACATTSPPASSFTLFPQLKEDAGQLVRAPLQWERSDWIKAAFAVAAVGGALWLDEDLREIVVGNDNDTKTAVAKAAGPFGAEYSFATLGAFYLAGKWLKDDRASAVAQDGLVSSVIAAGVITPLLKASIGRRRPSQTSGTFARGDGGVSFPSGHTTQAFAVATVIASHYDSLWVKGAAFAVAGLVGLSRMQRNAHYASDVLAGAIIGAAVANAVVRIHDEKRWTISATPRGAAVTVRW